MNEQVYEATIASLRAKLSHVEAERDDALRQLSRTLVKQRISLSDPPEVGWWWTPLGREGHDSQIRAEAPAPILAECDFAEEHQRHIANDEVLVEVGLIRHAALATTPTHDGAAAQEED